MKREGVAATGVRGMGLRGIKRVEILGVPHFHTAGHVITSLNIIALTTTVS